MLTRILLDTNVLGNHIDGTPPLVDLPAVRQRLWKYRISLADSTAEFVEGLAHSGLLAQWQLHVLEIDAVLDRRWPILPGGKELAALSGLQTDLTIDAANSQRYYQAVWHLLRDAKTAADLEAGTQFSDATGARFAIKVDFSHVRCELDKERGRWSKYVERKRDEFREKGITSGDYDRILAEITADFGAQPTDPPDFAKKADAVSRMVAKFLALALPKRDAYNPASDKRRGDVFDVSLLYAIPLPAVICTGDGPFVERLRQCNAPHAKQVVTVEEFNGHVRADTLDGLVSEHRTTAEQCQRWREAAYFNWRNRNSPPNDDWTDWLACEPIA